MNQPTKKTFFITGASSGFGRAMLEYALQQGFQVAATARKIDVFDALKQTYSPQFLPLSLEVTDSEQVAACVKQVISHFGRLDVVINNAGYGLLGALEEYTEQEIEHNFATNCFGPIYVMRAALPQMRKQKSGHIINISAIAAFDNEIGFSIYGGAKAAVEAVSQSLRKEVKALGIQVSVVEPGPFRTDFIGRSMVRTKNVIAEYAPELEVFAGFLKKINGKQPGDPSLAAKLIVDIAGNEHAPEFLPLGNYALTKIRKRLQSYQEEIEQWAGKAVATDFKEDS
jgi:NADP-dependent 3-hydroxy acid dehydrogenase YdfG